MSVQFAAVKSCFVQPVHSFAKTIKSEFHFPKIHKHMIAMGRSKDIGGRSV